MDPTLLVILRDYGLTPFMFAVAAYGFWRLGTRLAEAHIDYLKETKAVAKENATALESLVRIESCVIQHLEAQTKVHEIIVDKIDRVHDVVIDKVGQIVGKTGRRGE